MDTKHDTTIEMYNEEIRNALSVAQTQINIESLEEEMKADYNPAVPHDGTVTELELFGKMIRITEQFVPLVDNGTQLLFERKDGNGKVFTKTLTGFGAEHLERIDEQIVSTIRHLITGYTPSEKKNRRQMLTAILEREREHLAEFSKDEIECIISTVKDMRGFGKGHWGAFATEVMGRVGRNVIRNPRISSWLEELREGRGPFKRSMNAQYDRHTMFVSYAACEAAGDISIIKPLWRAIEDTILERRPELDKQRRRDGMVPGFAGRVSYICDVIPKVWEALDALARQKAEAILLTEEEVVPQEVIATVDETTTPPVEGECLGGIEAPVSYMEPTFEQAQQVNAEVNEVVQETAPIA